MQTTPTKPSLPPPIARFFAHESVDPQAVARCFVDDAIVHDEAREHHGRAAIAAWNADAVARYGVTTEPLEAQTTGLRTAVTAKVSGTFPGSPIQLRLVFTLAGDLIERLEIAP